jgi:hypothetical protein
MSDAMTRAEHLAWAKKRAVEIVKSGDINGGYASMASDLLSHSELSGHIAIDLGMLQMIGGNLGTEALMIDFIDGFN